jgi:hypothetical protein
VIFTLQATLPEAWAAVEGGGLKKLRPVVSRA